MANTEEAFMQSVLSLPAATLNQMVLHLERHSALGKDWREFAAGVGFNAKHIARIEAPHTGSSSRMVLYAWDKSGKSSVEKMVVALRYLGREDCLNVLKQDPSLKGGDFKRLYEIASRLRESPAERRAYFPDFGDGDLIIGDDIWPHPQPALCRHNFVEHEPLQSRPRPSSLAHSPDEVCQPLSVSHPEATDVTPSRDKVYISYYPDATTTPVVQSIAEDLGANGFTVEFANDRHMTDPEYKLTTITSSYNILVVCTQRYCTEYQYLANRPSHPSKIMIDRSLIHDIFFREQTRIICLMLDTNRPDYKHCVPPLYSARPIFRYPSQLTDLLHCVADVPKFIAPKPEARRRIEPIRIAFPNDVRRYDALHGVSASRSVVRREGSPRKPARVNRTPQKIAPRQIPSSNRPRILLRRFLKLL